MKMNLYVVFDRVAEESMPCFESRNDGTAFRAYQKQIIEKSDLPEDEMKLLCVGTINHDTNEITPQIPAREVTASISLVDQIEEAANG